MSNLKLQLENLVDQTLNSILEASTWSQPGAMSIANPGAHSTTPARKKDDTLADAVGGVETERDELIGQIDQLTAFQQQIASMAQQDPENPLAGQIMGMLGEGVFLQESVMELDIPPDIEPVHQQGVDKHHYSDDEVRGEGGLANSQLHQSLKDAEWLADHIEDSDELESWVQAKLTKAADYLNSVRNFIEYHKGGGQIKEAEKKTKVSKKIGHLIGKEGKPKDQAAAIAYSMEKRGEL